MQFHKNDILTAKELETLLNTYGNQGSYLELGLNKYRKQYYIQNESKIKENTNTYREQNGTKLAGKHNCICGGHYTYRDKATHSKTNKHTEFMASLYSNDWKTSLDAILEMNARRQTRMKQLLIFP
jgi:hypothetical protein